MDNSVFWGNLCSVLAMGTDTVSTGRKTTQSMLFFQTLSQLFYLVGAIVLKGYSAAVQNGVSIVRNVLAISKWQYRRMEYALIALAVALGLLFNNRGAVGLLPIIANLEYSLCVFRFRQNERALKRSFLLMVGMFIVFNAFILNFVGALSNLVVFVSTAVMLVKDRKASSRA